MIIRRFRSEDHNDNAISHPDQSRWFAVESDGIDDDLDGFISAITTIAQLRCERATGYVDIETLVCALPIDQWTFAADDSFAPYSGPYPMTLLVRAFLIARARRRGELTGELWAAIDVTKGFPFTSDVEDHEDDILGYRDGNQYYQWAVLKIVGMDVPLVLDTIPRVDANQFLTVAKQFYGHNPPTDAATSPWPPDS